MERLCPSVYGPRAPPANPDRAPDSAPPRPNKSPGREKPQEKLKENGKQMENEIAAYVEEKAELRGICGCAGRYWKRRKMENH